MSETINILRLLFTFSNDCKWSSHINNIYNSATKQISVLRKFKYIFCRNNLNIIYLSYSLPLLEYSCELWDAVVLGMQINWNAARIIIGLPIFGSRESLYFETGWESLETRRNWRKLSLFHEIHNNKAPGYMIECLSDYSNVGNYNLRNQTHYRVPRCRLETFSKSFFPSSIRSWNSLDTDISSVP